MNRTIPLPEMLDKGLKVTPVVPEADARFDTGTRRLHMNECAFPPSPAALAAMAEAVADAARYPDHACTALARRLTARTGIPADRQAFGAGSSELLTLIPRISLRPGDEAIMPAPTFPVCAINVGLAGARVINVPVTADGRNDIPAMLAALTDKTGLFYICTPNNPTGTALTTDDLKLAAREVPADCLLVVDEAYFEFSEAADGEGMLDILADRDGPWVVTRTFSKAYGLAGVRVGYAFTSDSLLCDALWNLRNSFNVNRIALAGAVAALDDDAWLKKVIDKTVIERDRLSSGLTELGFVPFPSAANFVTARSVGPAEQHVQALAANNIMAGAMPWPDENGCLRITVGQPDDTDAILRVLKDSIA
jgi:histidinol-phosphate aminotransferase